MLSRTYHLPGPIFRCWKAMNKTERNPALMKFIYKCDSSCLHVVCTKVEKNMLRSNTRITFKLLIVNLGCTLQSPGALKKISLSHTAAMSPPFSYTFCRIVHSEIYILFAFYTRVCESTRVWGLSTEKKGSEVHTGVDQLQRWASTGRVRK